MGTAPMLFRCLTWSTFIAPLLSLMWVFLVVRYLDIRPDYATREYLKAVHDGPKNYGVVHMNTINSINSSASNQSSSNSFFEAHEYFNLFYLGQSKNKINCNTQLCALIINANHKEAGQSYLSVYKEIEKINPNCKHNIFELSRKNHLLMNSQIIIARYAQQVTNKIVYFVEELNMPNLIIFAFEQGCAILIKSFQLLPAQTISKLGSIILINAYNPNIKIMFQTPYRFIHRVQHQLANDVQKMSVLNQTRLIFISTTSFWDSFLYQKEDHDKFNFLWGEKKLKNTLFLNTRFMKNIFTLMHDKDYFGYGHLSQRLARFLLMEQNNKLKLEQVQYFFNYGQIKGTYDAQLQMLDLQKCPVATPPQNQNVTVLKQTPCLILNMACNCRKPQDILLIITSKRAILLNDKSHRIDSVYQTQSQIYYIIQKVGNTKKIKIYNPYKDQLLFHTLYVFAPLSNPLPDSFFTSLSSTKVQNKQKYGPHMLIKICPHKNALLYPTNFQNYYPSGSTISQSFISLSKIVRDMYGISNKDKYKKDCYPDFSTQFSFVPRQWFTNWEMERNLILLVLLCSHTRKQTIFFKFYFYLVFMCVLTYNITGQASWLVNLLLISVAIVIQKVMEITGHLISFIQEMLDIKYRKFMVYVTLALAIVKGVGNHVQQLYHLSAWKLLCISLIFVVNKQNFMVLVCKLYFLMDNIIYNHNDQLEIVLVLLWIYVTLHQQSVSKFPILKSLKQNLNDKNIAKLLQIKQVYSTGIIEMLLVLGFVFFLNGPSYMLNTFLNLYIACKLLTMTLIKQQPNHLINK